MLAEKYFEKLMEIDKEWVNSVEGLRNSLESLAAITKAVSGVRGENLAYTDSFKLAETHPIPLDKRSLFLLRVKTVYNDLMFSEECHDNLEKMSEGELATYVHEPDLLIKKSKSLFVETDSYPWNDDMKKIITRLLVLQVHGGDTVPERFVEFSRNLYVSNNLPLMKELVHFWDQGKFGDGELCITTIEIPDVIDSRLALKEGNFALGRIAGGEDASEVLKEYLENLRRG